MPSETLLGVLIAAVTVNLLAMAVLVLPVLWGRGPLYRRLRAPIVTRPASGPQVAASRTAEAQTRESVRLVPRRNRRDASGEAAIRRALRPVDEGLDEVLGAATTGQAYNRAIRILAWIFILSCALLVAVSQVWQPVDRIVVVLMLGGVFVLVVHDLLPPGRLGPLRFLAEGSAGIVFLTLLVVLTDRSASPFFFLYPLLVGGAALVAGPIVTLILAVEATVAYVVAAFSEPVAADQVRRTWTNIGINLTALVLLTVAGVVIAREQKRTRETAIRLSTVDSLTDLFNRAYFFTVADREIERSRRFRRGFCLLMMDLDGLKAINDRFGHFHGDQVLRGVAQVIKAGLRAVDVPARYAGDEFVALLPETDPSGAFVVAEKIRQSVTELLIEAGGQHITTSLSIGVVSYPEDGETADELMIAADEAMYASKRLGKNRVVAFAEPALLPATPGAMPLRSTMQPTALRAAVGPEDAAPELQGNGA